MFKNIRTLSAFVGLVALFFASVAFLATCSSDDNDSPGKSSPGGQLRSSAITAPPDPTINVNIATFEVSLRNRQETLVVEFAASISIMDTAYDSKFDKVRIDLSYGNGDSWNEELLHEGPGSGVGFSWEDTKSISDDKYCGKTLKVCYKAYAKSIELPVKAACYGDIDGKQDPVREENICRPPSAPSIESSSSVVVSKPLSPVSFGGEPTMRINQNIGVKLSTGEETSVSAADIYYMPEPINQIRAGSGVTLMQNFNHPDYGCFEFWTSADAQTGVVTPSNTSQFFAPCGTEATSFDYSRNQYYLVKTNSATEWTSGWYIVVSNTTSGQAAGNTGIEIKAWKVD